MSRFHDEPEDVGRQRDQWEAEYRASGEARDRNVHPRHIKIDPEGVGFGLYDNTDNHGGGGKRDSGNVHSPSSSSTSAAGGSTSSTAGLLLIVALILGGLATALTPSSNHFTPPSSPFPPKPSDTRAITTWTYAKQHATHYMAHADFVPVTAPSADETSGYSGGGCMDFSTISRNMEPVPRTHQVAIGTSNSSQTRSRVSTCQPPRPRLTIASSRRSSRSAAAARSSRRAWRPSVRDRPCSTNGCGTTSPRPRPTARLNARACSRGTSCLCQCKSRRRPDEFCLGELDDGRVLLCLRADSDARLERGRCAARDARAPEHLLEVRQGILPRCDSIQR